MWSMSGRPCNPGSDLRQLWQTLLGKNTPFPQCGAPEKGAAEPSHDTPDHEQANQHDDAAGKRNR